MIRAYDEYGDMVDPVEWEEHIRQDERKKCIAQIRFKWEEALIKQIESDVEEHIRADERKKTIEFVSKRGNGIIVGGRNADARRRYWVDLMLKEIQKEQKNE